MASGPRNENEDFIDYRERLVDEHNFNKKRRRQRKILKAMPPSMREIRKQLLQKRRDEKFLHRPTDSSEPATS